MCEKLGDGRSCRTRTVGRTNSRLSLLLSFPGSADSQDIPNCPSEKIYHGWFADDALFRMLHLVQIEICVYVLYLSVSVHTWPIDHASIVCGMSSGLFKTSICFFGLSARLLKYLICSRCDTLSSAEGVRTDPIVCCWQATPQGLYLQNCKWLMSFRMTLARCIPWRHLSLCAKLQMAHATCITVYLTTLCCPKRSGRNSCLQIVRGCLDPGVESFGVSHRILYRVSYYIRCRKGCSGTNKKH